LLVKVRKKLKVASVGIRENLERLVLVMEHSTVKRQLSSFSKTLIVTQKTALSLLLAENVFDTSLVLARLGDSAELKPLGILDRASREKKDNRCS